MLNPQGRSTDSGEIAGPPVVTAFTSTARRVGSHARPAPLAGPSDGAPSAEKQNEDSQSASSPGDQSEEQGVLGSNPDTPTNFSLQIKALSRSAVSPHPNENGTERHRTAGCGTQSPKKVPKSRSDVPLLFGPARAERASMPVALSEQRTLGCAHLLGVVIATREQMAVDVHRHHDRRVPKPPLHDH